MPKVPKVPSSVAKAMADEKSCRVGLDGARESASRWLFKGQNSFRNFIRENGLTKRMRKTFLSIFSRKLYSSDN